MKSQSMQSPTIRISNPIVGLPQGGEIANVAEREVPSPTTSIETDSRAVNRGHKKARG